MAETGIRNGALGRRADPRVTSGDALMGVRIPLPSSSILSAAPNGG